MIKVKWLKPHKDFGYFADQVGFVTPEWAEKLLQGGFIMLIPEAEKYIDKIPERINPLPSDLPARDKLFAAGFEKLETIKAAGDALLDVEGISNTMLKKIVKYLK